MKSLRLTTFHSIFSLLLSGGTLVMLGASCVAQNQTTTTENPEGIATYKNRDKIGINLGGVSDYATEFPFADVFKTSRVWISQREGEPWGKGPEIELRSDGFPARLEENTWVDSPMLTVGKIPVPQGDYVLLYEGEGEFEFWPNVAKQTREPGRVVFQPKSDNPNVFFRLRKTNPDNPLRNVRIYFPGQAEAKPLFNPPFMEFARPFGTFRFMDWGRTNGNQLQKWTERPLPGDARYSSNKGVPIEIMIEFANAQNADAWFCMPHLADEEFVRNYAQLVKEKLKPGLKAYVEYSNEVWNGQFAQARYANEQGMELKLADKPWEAGWRYYAQRTVEMGRIWREVFGAEADERLVIVAASQAGNSYVARQILTWKDAHKEVDALAIAPYFGNRFGSHRTMNDVANQSLDQIFAELQTEVRGSNKTKSIGEHAQIAKQYGLKLLAYEGGQHLSGHGGAENNEKLTQVLIAANRDPRMAQLYKEHLENWFDAGGDVYAIFASHGTPSKWGSWGIKEYLGQPAEEAPKYQAVLDFIKSGDTQPQ